MQVAADGVPAVPLADHVAQAVGLAQPGGGAEDVADRDRAAEHGGRVLAHRVVGEGDEVVVPGEDLRPVGLLGACRVVVQGGDCGLDLVAAGALNGQHRLQDAHALGDLASVPQAAVLSVERVLAKRLSIAGTFDPAGVVAEIKALAAEAQAKEAAARNTAPGDAQALTRDAAAGGGPRAAAATAAVNSTGSAKLVETIIRLETLQPKLQQCVIRAKI